MYQKKKKNPYLNKITCLFKAREIREHLEKVLQNFYSTLNSNEKLTEFY